MYRTPDDGQKRWTKLVEPDSAWKRSSNLHETYQYRMYNRELLMMGREDARNM
jgi:hypothetical protein